MFSIYIVTMIVEIKIENFGIIESLCICPRDGLNIISGESGSGKSLVMNALDLALGARVVPGMVRSGADRAVIEIIFEKRSVLSDEELSMQNNSTDFENKDDFIRTMFMRYASGEECISFRREVTSEGRSRMYCNGELSTLSQVRSLTNKLIEIHSQQEHQRIIDLDTHLKFLDIFAETQGLCREVAELYHRFNKIRNKLHSSNIELEERESRKAFLHFAIDEIESFTPKTGEFEELNNEKALIENSGRLFQDICAGYSLLREEDFAILTRLTSLTELLEPHTNLIPELQNHMEQTQEAAYILEAVADFLRDQKGRLKFSPDRLEDINERLSGYQALYKKYGGNTVAVNNLHQKYLSDLGSIEMNSKQLEEEEKELVELHELLLEKSEHLSRLRRSAIPKLETKIALELESLGMQGAIIDISVKREENLREGNLKSDDAIELQEKKENSNVAEILTNNKYFINDKGLDRVEFLLTSNPGENPRPLRKIASGGELSRISLAFKNIFFDEQPVGTIVFDEVDVGVGGELAHDIGDRIKDLSKQSQVIVVTHLPQIARLADQHFYVSKQQVEGRSLSYAKLLKEQERPYELARMLGGEKTGTAVLQHAKDLLVKV